MFHIIKKFVPKFVKRKILLFIHRGNRYVCPICNYSSKDLSAIGSDSPVLKEKHVIGAGKRKGACYKCGATDREKLIYMFLKEKIGIFNGKQKLRILHVAPESMLFKKLKEVGFQEYICGDLFTEGYNYPEQVVKLSVLNIPYSDNYFDFIICNHVLEHVEDDRKAINELYRVLKPHGIAILQVPLSANSHDTIEDFSVITPEAREKAFGQFDHVRIYGQDYPERLEASGFTVSREKVPASYKKYGVCMEEDVFVCSK